MCCSEAAAHAVATLAEATLQGGGQIFLAETAAAVGALAGAQDATGITVVCLSSTHSQNCTKHQKIGLNKNTTAKRGIFKIPAKASYMLTMNPVL